MAKSTINTPITRSLPPLYDMHSHFLPGMDDGCKTPEESLQVLRASARQGVVGIFATPHYYPVEPVEDFLQRRQRAVEKLLPALEGEALPQISLGAEVAFRPGLSYEASLDRLCLGNTRYLLLEMPFDPWSKDALREIWNISSARGIIPVLAHIERYLSLQSSTVMNRLLEQDVLVQMNSGFTRRFSQRRQAKKLLRWGQIQLLGSDCHNMTTRPAEMGLAAACMQQWGMEDTLAEICQLSEEIFSQAQKIAR